MSRHVAITCDRCKAEVGNVSPDASRHTPRVALPTGETQHDGGPGNDTITTVRQYDLCRDCLAADHNALLLAALRALGKERYLALLRDAKITAPKNAELWGV